MFKKNKPGMAMLSCHLATLLKLAGNIVNTSGNIVETAGNFVDIIGKIVNVPGNICNIKNKYIWQYCGHNRTN